MELLIIVNGKGKRYEIKKPVKCSDKDMTDWLFVELEESTLKHGNKLQGQVLGELNYICDLKCKG